MAIEGLGQQRMANSDALPLLLDIIDVDGRAHYRQAAALAALRLTASANVLRAQVFSGVFATLDSAWRKDTDRYVCAYCYAALLRLALRTKGSSQSKHFLTRALGAEAASDLSVCPNDDVCSEESLVNLLPLSSVDARTERALSALRLCPKTTVSSPF
jgi:hypothetical protein